MNEKMNIQFPFESKEWDFIEDLNSILNNIVHCNGRVYASELQFKLTPGIHGLRT
ncbi:hypothetical protein DJ93_4814 [Bacillus clarus]|uniref:Uncharacterized protein n=1 Tax=Bacillus clarus TaxID=2338372 RepID=A0A090Z1B0_9BACI|nr:hypothetical protein DJ93_4814 [Bacillus clarus]